VTDRSTKAPLNFKCNFHFIEILLKFQVQRSVSMKKLVYTARWEARNTRRGAARRVANWSVLTLGFQSQPSDGFSPSGRSNGDDEMTRPEWAVK